MKIGAKTKLFWSGCFLLGAGSTVIWGLKGIIFGIGLVMMFGILIYKDEIEEKK